MPKYNTALTTTEINPETDEENWQQLPLEVLLYILSFLKEPLDVVRAKMVNRTWWHLIENSPKMMENVLKSYLSQISPNISRTILQQKKEYLIEAARYLHKKTQNPLLSKTQIVLEEQFQPQVISQIHSDAQYSAWWWLHPQKLFIMPTWLIKMFYVGLWLMISFGAAIALCTEKDPCDGVADYLLIRPLRMLTMWLTDPGIIAPYIIFLAYYFFKSLKNNIQNSNQIFENQISDIENHLCPSLPNRENLNDFVIQSPVSLMTISWKRSTVFRVARKSEATAEEQEEISFENKKTI